MGCNEMSWDPGGCRRLRWDAGDVRRGATCSRRGKGLGWDAGGRGGMWWDTMQRDAMGYGVDGMTWDAMECRGHPGPAGETELGKGG